MSPGGSPRRRGTVRSWLLVALAAGATVACSPEASAPPPSDIGGPFALVDTRGAAVSDADLRGKPSAVFFGFTYCPEICPTTLGELTVALEALGPDADRLNVVFVSVDPERDTPEELALYLSHFDRRIRGFTGSPEAVDAMTRAYRVYHRKVPLEGGDYTIDHSSMIYLFNPEGAFVEHVSYGEPVEVLVERLRALLRAG